MTCSSDDTRSLTEHSIGGPSSINGNSVQSGSIFAARSDASGLTREEAYSAPAIAKREQTCVLVSKILVFVVLMLAVCALATTAFSLVSEEEEDNFETQVRARRV